MIRYLCNDDVTKIFKLITGSIPNAKYNEDTMKAWMTMFGHVDRLKLLLSVKQFLLSGAKFFPTVSEINAEVIAHGNEHPYWQPAKDAKDQRCLWFMELNGITSVDNLTQAQVDTIYEIAPDSEVHERT